jgi:hypothetical protein
MGHAHVRGRCSIFHSRFLSLCFGVLVTHAQATTNRINNESFFTGITDRKSSIVYMDSDWSVLAISLLEWLYDCQAQLQDLYMAWGLGLVIMLCSNHSMFTAMILTMILQESSLSQDPNTTPQPSPGRRRLPQRWSSLSMFLLFWNLGGFKFVISETQVLFVHTFGSLQVASAWFSFFTPFCG